MAEKEMCFVSKNARFRITMTHIQRKMSATGLVVVVDAGKDIQFKDSQFVTSDPEEIKFLENCKSFKNGNIFHSNKVPEKLEDLIAMNSGVEVVSTISNTNTVVPKTQKPKATSKKK